jgi:hypothetical protein
VAFPRLMPASRWVLGDPQVDPTRTGDPDPGLDPGQLLGPELLRQLRGRAQAGVGASSSSCPATSARRRSSDTRWSPVNWQEAIDTTTCPADRPRSWTLFEGMWASKALTNPSTRSVSLTPARPAHGVNDASAARTPTPPARRPVARPPPLRPTLATA